VLGRSRVRSVPRCGDRSPASAEVAGSVLARALDILLCAQFSNRECTRMNAKIKRKTPTADQRRFTRINLSKPASVVLLRFICVHPCSSAVRLVFVFICVCSVTLCELCVSVMNGSGGGLVRRTAFAVKVHHSFTEELIGIFNGANRKHQR
jgi:hypothetical protein